MARRSPSGMDLVEVLARTPWWVGVLLAAVSWFVLSALASKPLTSAGARGPSVDFIAIAATVLRWIVPLMCLAGALGSVLARRRRVGLFDAARSGGRAAVAAMDWRQFELLVGEAFRRKGYGVVETGGGGADGGVDLVVKRGEEVALVQCKHWKAWQVGLPAVRELLGAMTAHRATKAWLVTSGRFTDEAVRFAREHHIDLVDGLGLTLLLDLPPAQTASFDGTAAACPMCGAAMVLRSARRGASAGSQFWGCSRYPDCRGTRPGAVRASDCPAHSRADGG